MTHLQQLGLFFSLFYSSSLKKCPSAKNTRLQRVTSVCDKSTTTVLLLFIVKVRVLEFPSCTVTVALIGQQLIWFQNFCLQVICLHHLAGREIAIATFYSRSLQWNSQFFVEGWMMSQILLQWLIWHRDWLERQVTHQDPWVCVNNSIEVDVSIRRAHADAVGYRGRGKGNGKEKEERARERGRRRKRGRKMGKEKGNWKENLLCKPSYSPFCPKFRCHGNGGRLGKNAIGSIRWPIPKNPHIGAKISQISLTRGEL